MDKNTKNPPISKKGNDAMSNKKENGATNKTDRPSDCTNARKSNGLDCK